MPDILVTTPKSEIASSRKEAADVEKHGGHYFRTFKRLPNVQPGDKIYFVEDGQIRGYGVVFEIKREPMVCATTGRTWAGHHVCYSKWVWLKEPVSYKGFQGHRYISRLPPDMQQQLHRVA